MYPNGSNSNDIKKLKLNPVSNNTYRNGTNIANINHSLLSVSAFNRRLLLN